MNILHYTLGVPPFRTGGLTKFCFDLMSQQEENGDNVSVIWPGHFNILKKETKIKKRGIDKWVGYEIINPNIVPYDEGIKNIAYFMDNGDYKEFDSFFKKYRFDILHIHTFMGIQRNFIKAAKKNDVKVIFTTHDFYPICPRVKMFFDGEKCKYAHDFKYCSSCNMTGLPIWKLKLLQSNIYVKLKNCSIFKYFRKRHRNKFFKKKTELIIENKNAVLSYKKLRNYYNDIFNEIDYIHYNSDVAKKVYDEYFGIHVGKIIDISHNDILDRRRLFEPHKDLQITYLGPQNIEKGYFLLKSALDIVKQKRKIKLNIFFDPIVIEPYMSVHKAYTYRGLKEIFDNSDLVIVPSLWSETYGFNVLEAMSYAVPVIVSENVGAKDIIPAGGGIIVKEEMLNANGLARIILNITINQIRKMNNILCNDGSIVTMDIVSKEIKKYCYEGERTV